MKSRANASLIDTSLLIKELDVQSDPHSNTGSDSRLSPKSGWCAGVDNLTILWSGKASLVKSVCTSYFGIEFDWESPVPRKIGVYWDRTWVGEGGALLCERDSGDGRVHSRLALGGKLCGSVTPLKLRGFALWCQLNLPVLRVSRIDIAIDDFDKAVSPNQIIEALKREEYSGFKKADIVINHCSTWGGWCLYLGRRESDKILRVYDKYAESKGAINSYRWELEAHDSYAQVIFGAWCECTHDEDEIQHLLVNYAIGQLRFLKRVDKNLARCPNLDWWDNFIAHLNSSPVRVVVTRIVATVQKKIDWVRRSVAKSLAVIHDSVGSSRCFDLIAEEIESARLRYTGMDLLAIKKYKHLIDS